MKKRYFINYSFPRDSYSNSVSTVYLLIPVSLEKMVPCVMTAAQHTGIYHFKYATGLPAKIVPLLEAKAITEIEAFAILCGVRAYHVGSGGVAGSQGSVHLSLEGDEDKIEQAMELVKSLKDEPPVRSPCELSNIFAILFLTRNQQL